MHANWMHDILVAGMCVHVLNDQKNEINFLNSRFPFRMFRELTHKYTTTSTVSSEIERASRARMLSLPRRVFYFEISKCGIQDFNSILRFIWYNIHQVIGLLTDVSESCTNAFSIAISFPFSLSPIRSCTDAMHMWVNIEWWGSIVKFRLFIFGAFQILILKKYFWILWAK